MGVFFCFFCFFFFLWYHVGVFFFFFFFQAEDGIRDVERSRGLGDVYKRQYQRRVHGNIKDLQTKVTETMTLQIMPQADQANEEEKREEAMNQFMEETNEKVAKLKDAISTFKSEFEALSRGVEEKIELKASKESLVDLENKLYKEIDKVVATLTKRFSESPTAKKGTKFLEVQVRKLFELYNALISSRESEESTFIKKPLGGYSCAACEKEIKNLYNMINQDPEYANWNKFPIKEGTLTIPKAAGYSKIISSRGEGANLRSASQRRLHPNEMQEMTGGEPAREEESSATKEVLTDRGRVFPAIRK
eukprot:TRINITY_DN3865_c0_g1_i1.p1 TRINITY_DN3865_c0_g1~~TRINITY_DN3865_c0_g1_i1.p1  ORF type:complete len:306 (-),score=104.04 TRINITY_DN3865_c0_g1_i1:35-952(-)